MSKPYFRTAAVLTLCLLCLLQVSCSRTDDNASFITLLDEVDGFIRLGETEYAYGLLNKASRKSSSAYSRLGIYKRYIQLGETKKAGEVLAAARKRFPDNREVQAVYCEYLLSENQIDKALEESRTLSGTEYSSFYAEAVFRAANMRTDDCESVFIPQKKYKAPKKSRNASSLKDFFRDNRMIPVYEDAWSSTGQGMWLRNAAALKMKNGETEAAVSLVPDALSSREDELFWGIVFYDASLYVESLQMLLNSGKLLPEEFSERNGFEYINEEITLLASDDYYVIGDDEASQKQRDAFFAMTEAYLTESESGLDNASVNSVNHQSGKSADHEDERSNVNHQSENDLIREDERRNVNHQNENALNNDDENQHSDNHLGNKIFSKLYAGACLNSSKYMKEKDRNKQVYYLEQLLEHQKTNRNALAEYAVYAMNLEKRGEESKELAELRKSGLKTLGMEAYDREKKLTLDEVIALTDSAISENPSGELVVLKQNLCDVQNKKSSKAEKNAGVWSLLERNATEKNEYPPEIMQYAVYTLIKNGAVSDAGKIFEKYLIAKYPEKETGRKSKNKQRQFNPEEKKDELSLWEAELCAWFAAKNGNNERAVNLYDYIVKKWNSRAPGRNSNLEKNAFVNSCMNLAEIYCASGNQDMALSLLNKASGRTFDSSKKAEIIYRMAYINYSQGDYESAMLSLKYALKLNPNHSKAQLLLKKI